MRHLLVNRLPTVPTLLTFVHPSSVIALQASMLPASESNAYDMIGHPVGSPMQLEHCQTCLTHRVCPTATGGRSTPPYSSCFATHTFGSNGGVVRISVPASGSSTSMSQCQNERCSRCVSFLYRSGSTVAITTDSSVASPNQACPQLATDPPPLPLPPPSPLPPDVIVPEPEHGGEEEPPPKKEPGHEDDEEVP